MFWEVDPMSGSFVPQLHTVPPGCILSALHQTVSWSPRNACMLAALPATAKPPWGILRTSEVRTLNSWMVEGKNKMWQKLNYGEPLLKELKCRCFEMGSIKPTSWFSQDTAEATWQSGKKRGLGLSLHLSLTFAVGFGGGHIFDLSWPWKWG